MDNLKKIIDSLITFINGSLVPLVFAIAFIVFLYGVFRYFVLGGANEEKRKEGRQLIIYSVVGFAVMIVIWGLVNLIIGTLGLTNTAMPALPTFTTTNSTSQTTQTGTNAGAATGNGTANTTDTNPCPDGTTRNMYGICTDPSQGSIY